MCPRPKYANLCRLLDESLQPFSDIAANSLTDENEKDLLIALSKVFRQVKEWTHESDSDEELLSGSFEQEGASIAADLRSDNRQYLAKTVGDLMFLLSVNNQYVQHLVGSILVAISEFALGSDTGWDDFIRLMYLCLELAICNCLSLESRNLDFDLLTSKSLLKLKLKSANWFVVAAIFRVLRNILRNLNRDFDEKIMKVYLDSVSSLMLNIPLHKLIEIYVGHDSETCKESTRDVLLQTEITRPRDITVFFGNFIQFLCSLVAQSSFSEDGIGRSPVICKVINLVPKLVAWCHDGLQSSHPARSSHYFRHKVLMLMIKLSFSVEVEQTILVTWMHLLHEYFEDLLLQPISENVPDQDGSLEGSPFCTSINNTGAQSMLSRHLQRLVVFLFLKCSLNMVSTKDSPGEQQCADENSVSLMEINKWLDGHVPADIYENNELYLERCLRFTSSFLQLFMHEDDILFEMLLQLFRVPFYPKHQVVKDRSLAEAKDSISSLASDLFNPVHLFHLFLAKIHYDHQVLLDYLISKDTGSNCAEYLLRSLRIICNSWKVFVEFRGAEESSIRLCLKRNQKVAVECKDDKNSRRPFVAAKECLLSLRTSINNLYQKNLFPYNPQVLLRRLLRFEELCMKR